jgi:hypothetical protein
MQRHRLTTARVANFDTDERSTLAHQGGLHDRRWRKARARQSVGDPTNTDARILSSVRLPTANATVVERRPMSRAGFARRMLAEARHHEVAVLGSFNIYERVLLAAALARRGTPVLLMECHWEPGSRRLSRLLGSASITPGVDMPVRPLPGFASAISAHDHPRMHYAVLSSEERELFSQAWKIDPDRIHVTPYWAPAASPDWGDDVIDTTVFAGGDSLRDYRSLLEAAPMIDGEVFIATHLPMPPSCATVRAVPHAEYTALSRGARVHVVPLVDHAVRGAGHQTYLSAMALGRPVVVTDSPGVREYVEDGVTGFVVPNEAGVLADTINMLLADASASERVGAAAKQAVASNYTGHQYHRRLCDLASTIAADR